MSPPHKITFAAEHMLSFVQFEIVPQCWNCIALRSWPCYHKSVARIFSISTVYWYDVSYAFLRIWNMYPSYRWGVTWCFQERHTTNHSQSCSLISANGRAGSTQMTMGAWSGTQRNPRPIKALVLGCADGVSEGDTDSILGFTLQYSSWNICH